MTEKKHSVGPLQDDMERGEVVWREVCRENWSEGDSVVVS